MILAALEALVIGIVIIAIILSTTAAAVAIGGPLVGLVWFGACVWQCWVWGTNHGRR